MTLLRSLPRPAVVAALIAVAAGACSEGTGPDGGDRTRVTVVSGDAQTGPVGQPLPNALVVKVVDRDGKAVPGATVAWSTTGGTLGASATTTDAAGVASTSLTLAHGAGEDTVTAAVGAATARFVVTADGFLAEQLAVGRGTACALDSGGRAYCWGIIAGASASDSASTCISGAKCDTRARPLLTDLRFASLVASGEADHMCGLTAAGAAHCWGSNVYGELGDGTTVARRTPAPVAGGLAFTKLALGWGISCGIIVSGEAYCWGQSVLGSLGVDTTAATIVECVHPLTQQASKCAKTPQRVAGSARFTALGVSMWASCAIEQGTGAVHCWGTRHIDDSALALDWTPRARTDAPVASALSGSLASICALTADGRAFCWGYNTMAQTGTGRPGIGAGGGPVLTPTEIAGGRRYTSVSASNTHQCALTTAGEPYCSGRNFSGQFGNGTSNGNDEVPVPVLGGGGKTFASVQVGDGFTCGLTPGRVVYCAGANYAGQLGIGTVELTGNPIHPMMLVRAPVER